MKNTPQKVSRSRGRRSNLGANFGADVGFDYGSGTNMPETTEVVSTVSSAATTVAKTPEPTTAHETTTVQESQQTTIEITTVSTAEENNQAILVLLDETGSMQDLGGKGRRKGRDIVIKKMETFRKMLEKSVGNDKLTDQPITFVTFNIGVKWNEYKSIKDWPALTRKDYNPGYQTNLYDTLGCVLSKYYHQNSDKSVQVYVISDGIHKMKKKERHLVDYDVNSINDMITELRDGDWDFNFFGATDTAGKAALKKEAIDLGFRNSELKTFDFNGQAFGSMLKTMRKSIVKGGRQEKVVLPDCKVLKPCKKGKRGRNCRRGRKTLKDAGRCV